MSVNVIAEQTGMLAEKLLREHVKIGCYAHCNCILEVNNLFIMSFIEADTL